MASVWGGDDPSVAWGQNSWQSNILTQAVTGYGFDRRVSYWQCRIN